MYFPSQPVTSMRLIGFEDNFFARPAGAKRSKKKLSYMEMREWSLGLEAAQERIDEMYARWGSWRSEVKRS
jgi:hypothetical protein